MKIRFFLIISFCVFLIQLLCSCKNDETDESVDYKLTNIKYAITCDNDTAQMYADATGMPQEGIYCKRSLNYTCDTQYYFAVVNVNCNDSNATVSVKLFVNNVLKIQKEGKGGVSFSIRLKGKGQYLNG